MSCEDDDILLSCACVFTMKSIIEKVKTKKQKKQNVNGG